jgi:hypothetical protein
VKKAVVCLCALLATAGAAWGGDCSCVSPDGSCSASVTCPSGCYATCGTLCEAGCTSGRGPGGGAQSPTKPPLTLTLKGATDEDLSATLSQQLGVTVAYVSPQALNLDLQEIGLEDLLHVLSKSGAVAILHAAPPSQKVTSETRVSLRAVGAEASAIAEALDRVSGGAITFSPRNSEQPVSLDVKDVSAGDLVRILAGLGRARLATPADRY